MGRSNPDEEVCKHTPRSADPIHINITWIMSKEPVMYNNRNKALAIVIITYQEVGDSPQQIAMQYEMPRV